MRGNDEWLCRHAADISLWWLKQVGEVAWAIQWCRKVEQVRCLLTPVPRNRLFRNFTRFYCLLLAVDNLALSKMISSRARPGSIITIPAFDHLPRLLLLVLCDGLLTDGASVCCHWARSISTGPINFRGFLIFGRMVATYTTSWGYLTEFVGFLRHKQVLLQCLWLPVRTEHVELVGLIVTHAIGRRRRSHSCSYRTCNDILTGWRVQWLDRHSRRLVNRVGWWCCRFLNNVMMIPIVLDQIWLSWWLCRQLLLTFKVKLILATRFCVDVQVSHVVTT